VAESQAAKETKENHPAHVSGVPLSFHRPTSARGMLAFGITSSVDSLPP